jgi:hypothetical protein
MLKAKEMNKIIDFVASGEDIGKGHRAFVETIWHPAQS